MIIMQRFFSLFFVLLVVGSFSSVILFRYSHFSLRDLLAIGNGSSADIIPRWLQKEGKSSPEKKYVIPEADLPESEITTPVSLALIEKKSLSNDSAGNWNFKRASQNSRAPNLESLSLSQEISRDRRTVTVTPEKGRPKDFLGGTIQKIPEYLFRVQNIELIGNVRVSQGRIFKLLQLEPFPWVWQVSKQELISRLTRNPWIETAKVQLSHFPNTLKISIVEAQPWMVAELGGNSWLISRSGALLQALGTLEDSDLVVEMSKLPRVIGLGSGDLASVTGSLANERFINLVTVLKFIDAAGGFPFEVESYAPQIDGSALVFPLNSRQVPKVVVAPKTFSEAEENLRELRLVINDLQRRSEPVAEIDLRYHKQAVVRLKRANG